MYFYFGNDCCGFAELCGVDETSHLDESRWLQRFADLVKEAVTDHFSWSPSGFGLWAPPFLLMSSATGSVKRVLPWLRKRRFGKIHETSPRYNPTGSLNLVGYLWEPNWKIISPYVNTRLWEAGSSQHTPKAWKEAIREEEENG